MKRCGKDDNSIQGEWLMKCNMIVLLCLMAATVFSQTITLVSPNGGETYHAGQTVDILWTHDEQISRVHVEYSYDNGTIWMGISDQDSAHFYWTVPYMKKTMDHVLLRVTALTIDNPPSDVSDGSFTILASPPDAYEPNDDFASAYPIALGDSVVKNAKVFYNLKKFNPSGPEEMDSSNSDWDYYKIRVHEGKVLTVTAFCDSEGQRELNPFIALFDSSYQQLTCGKSGLQCKIPKSGIYYLQVLTSGYQWFTYGLSISPGEFELLTPFGGETVVAGQETHIGWLIAGSISGIILEYSCDNAKTWNKIQAVTMPLDSLSITSGRYMWTVPARKQSTNQALVRATFLSGIGNAASCVSGAFTIRATPPDAYEPNNDFAHAYPIAIGDSVVKNAWVFMNENAVIAEDTVPLSPQHPRKDLSKTWDDTLHLDADVYRISLPAGKLVTISMFPCFSSSRFGYTYGLCPPAIDVFNDSGKGVAFTYSGPDISGPYVNPEYQCAISRSGVYYIKILPPGLQSWANYGLSIKTMTILSTQTSAIDTAAMQKTNGDTYMTQLNSETTKLQLNLTFNKRIPGSITTSVLSPDELSFAENTTMKVKAVSIGATDTNFSKSITAADISIPYTLSSLNGNPQKSLAVFWLNNSTRQWTPVSSSVDTVKHEIIAHATHFSIYGVFVGSNTAIASIPAAAASVFGIKADFLSQKHGIAVRCMLPQAQTVKMRIFDIQGKCVGNGATRTAGSGNISMFWDVGTLGNGKYLCTIKAGAYQAQKTIVIIK